MAYLCIVIPIYFKVETC